MDDEGLTSGQWRHLFDGHPSVMLLLDPCDGTVVSANGAARRFYGYGDRLGDLDLGDLDRSDGTGTLAASAADNAASGRVSRCRHQLANGEFRELEVEAAPLTVDRRRLVNAVIRDVTEQQRTVEALAVSEGFASSIVTGVPIGIAVADLDGRLIRVNEAMSSISGLAEHELLGREQHRLGHPDDLERMAEAQARLRSGETDAYELQHRYLRADGSIAHVRARTSYLRDGDGRARFQLTVLEDISEQALAERHTEQLREELADSHRRFEALVEHASDPIIVLDADGRITYLSPAATHFLGSDVRSTPQLLRQLSEPDRVQVTQAWQALLQGRGTGRQAVLQVTRADGRARHLAVTVSDLRHIPAVDGIVVAARDLTDELAVRARLEHQTTHDGLTGLANRDLLIDELRRFVHSDHHPDRHGLLILLDLVGMAGINDRIGHRTGDYLLRSVAQRLEEAVGDEGVVARTSGDEFGVLIPGGAGERDALETVARFAALFNRPYATPGGGTVLLRARFGVALTATAGGAPASVLRDANLALKATREPTSRRIRVCDDLLRSQEERRLTLEYELATPSITSELELEYQPLIDLDTGGVTELEALVRWRHPDLGTIGPSEFIPLAERNGSIVAIGAWVLRSACRQLAAWDAAGVTPRVGIAVNLSARQLLDVDLVPTLATALDETGLAPERVILEITETAIADDSEVTTATVAAIAELGVRIYIDDFGTGYSSFAQLGRFPFHGLKIDRSFITPLGSENDAAPVVSALLAIATAQGLEVIAEGVEEEQQLDELRALGCRRGQGFLWAPPLPVSEVPAHLAARGLGTRAEARPEATAPAARPH